MQAVLLTTPNKDNQSVGQLISTHDDDVQLTGTGYSGFTIVKIPAMTQEDFTALIEDIDPVTFSGLTIADINTLLTASKADAETLLTARLDD